MPSTPTQKPTQPRRLTRLKVSEVSLCTSPANQHARALLAKSADAVADLDQRMAALEHQRAMIDAPGRLLKAMAVRGEELRAAAEGRAHLPPLPDAPMAKAIGGGPRLVARATEIAKAHRVGQATQREPRHAATPTKRSEVPPAQGLIAAAHRRAAMMQAG